MAWFKVDDKLHSHKKSARAGVAAMGLWTLAGSWSADQLTDGFIPDYIAERLAPGASEQLAKELVAAGLWIDDVYDGDTGWRFRDWTDYQPTREEAEARRERERDKKRNQRRNTAGQYATSPGDSPGDTGGSPTVPTRPDPSRPKEPTSKRATRIPDDWQPDDEPALTSEADSAGIDLTRELARFRDYWQAQSGQRGRKADWQATWRNWLRKAVDDRGGPARASPPVDRFDESPYRRKRPA